MEAGERPDTDSQILAVGKSVASQRIAVEVPTEGFFGHWKASGIGFWGLPGIGRGSTPTAIDSDLAQPTFFKQPAYTASGQALVDTFDDRFDFPALQCKSSVIDGIYHHGNVNEFVQESDTSIRWLYGYMDLLRTIHLDQTEHPENTAPSLLGHSYGFWEGDSLVVETAGFTRQWLYQVIVNDDHTEGHVISSENLTLRERITHDEKNDHLVVEYWAEDPDFWQEPVSGTYRLVRSSTPYQDYNCIELGGYNNLRENGKTIFE